MSDRNPTDRCLATACQKPPADDPVRSIRGIYCWSCEQDAQARVAAGMAVIEEHKRQLKGEV